MRKTAFLLALIATPVLADLGSEVRGTSGWAAYQVPIVEGRHSVCSWDSVEMIGDDGNTVSSALIVLLHVTNGTVDNVRVTSPECRMQHSAKWIRNVDPAESRRFLRELIDTERVGKKAVTALALHRDAEGDLIEIARRHPSSKMRGSALFWVGTRAGDRAAATLRDALENDPDEGVKKKAVFGIAQLPDERSVPLLIDLLKTHRSKGVRKQAAFWLSQKQDPRALAAFEESLGVRR